MTTEINRLIRSVPVITLLDSQLVDYAIVDVKPGATYRIRFGVPHYPGSRDDYLFITPGTVSLFCDSPYYGALLAIYEQGELRWSATYFVRADAIVISRNSEPYLTPICRNSDMFWGEGAKTALYLSSHFRRRYQELFNTDRHKWEYHYHRLLRIIPTIEVGENSIVFQPQAPL